jgi:hypothetical protein
LSGPLSEVLSSACHSKTQNGTLCLESIVERARRNVGDHNVNCSYLYSVMHPSTSIVYMCLWDPRDPRDPCDPLNVVPYAFHSFCRRCDRLVVHDCGR